MPIRNKEKLGALAAKLAKVPTSTPEYKNWIQRLDKAAQNGNQEAKYTLDKTMEIATANRKGYDDLQEFTMAATMGVPGISSFVGSKVGEKYGTVGGVVGGLVGGIIGSSHDIMNIGKNTKKFKSNKDFKNFTEYDAGIAKYSDEPVKVDDKISYLSERLKSGATNRTNIEENFYTIPTYTEDNPYLKLNNFKDYEKVWDFVQKYTPAKIIRSKYPSPAKANPSMNLIIMRDNIKYQDINTPPFYRDDFNNVVKNPFVKNGNISKDDYRNIIDHELYHLIEKNRWTEHYIPETNLLDFMIDDNDLVRMLIDNNGDELAARVVQVKNHNKVSDGKRTFSGEEYKKMFEKYIEDGAVDNNIFDTYESISDWDKFAKWANRIIPFSISGIKKKDNAE